MRKAKQLKYLVILPPIVLITVFFFLYGHATGLKASPLDSLVNVTVGSETVRNDTFITNDETVELKLQARETDIYELSFDKDISVIPLDEYGNVTSYPQVDATDFKKRQALTLFEEQFERNQTSDSKEAKDDDATTSNIEEINEANQRLPYYQVNKEEGKGSFYFELEKNQVQHLRIIRLTKGTKTVGLRSVKDSSQTQSIVTFQKAHQLTEELENSELSKEKAEEETIKEIDSRGLNTTNPFKVETDVDRSTGVAPFDTKKEPGYDTSAEDDIVRTFDLVNYRVMLGISNIDEKYSSLRIRLDTELEEAWRKDSSGQIRQTAEVSNGTLADTGEGTKKSTRSSWLTLDKAAGQVYFTESLETFGGVNGDQLKPKFTVTIESATLKAGGTEEINQLIDSSVEPSLEDVVTISAKPLVDINITRDSTRISSFEKTTGTNDKPFSLIAPVAAYVQLKPLPGRSDTTSLKGSTYPVGGVKYKINQKIDYSGNGINKTLSIGTDTEPVEVIAYDGLSGIDMPNRKFTSEYAVYENEYQPVQLAGTKAPYGYTKQTYPSDQAFIRTIGIYDTGNPIVKNESSDYSISVVNDNYVPISVGENKWLYDGTKMASNAEPFSVVAMQMRFPYEYLENQVGVTSTLNYTLTITEVEYEGEKQEIDSRLVVPWDRKWPGTMTAYAAFNDFDKKKLSSTPSNTNIDSMGDGVTAQGNELFPRYTSSFTDPIASQGYLYARWNVNSFQYKSNNSVTRGPVSGTTITNYYYGVGFNIPDDNLRTQKQIDSAYTWYPTVTAAKSAGEISAVKCKYEIDIPDGRGSASFYVPLYAVGKTAKDSSGNANVTISNAFNFTDGGTETQYSPSITETKYVPSKYDDEGSLLSAHSPSRKSWDTLYIAGMIIRPTITTDKKVYAPGEKVTWTVEGKVDSGSENNHKVQYVVTLPKETQYNSGTAEDHEGNALPDPIITENDDGTWTLKWVLDYMSKDSSYNPKVVFDTSIISSKLNFINNAAMLNGKVVAGVWLEDDESMKDVSIEGMRTSTTDITVTNSGVITLDKVVDKSYIESGNEIDPANSSDVHPTDFTYTVSFKNHSTSSMTDVRILDVLPYNSDERGTNFQGTYSLVNLKQLSGSIQGTVWYTNNSISADIDPNAVNLNDGWSKLGVDMSVLQKSKAVMVVYDNLASGKDMSFSLTLRPTGQKAGDKYVNTPSLNSQLNKFVQGVPSTVRVYGRDLSGVAWYDDNLDGLIGNTSSGTAENWAKDIPVKLYRTSLEVSSYKKELVEESLTGKKFVDDNGDSLVKTDVNGKYLFESLPEGEYIVEFVVGNKFIQREIRVTEKLVGEDEKLNSNADQDNFQTDKYSLPILNEVAGLDTEDSKFHVTDVNIGLIRPSTIRLFKFETGSAVDINDDGQLSDAEKAKGTPLKGAEFEIYESNNTAPIATESTDSSGYLIFVKLFPGEHTLIETKAPFGYELIKTPIKVMITEGNQTIQIYQENDKGSNLPFTGGAGPMFITVMSVSLLGVIGLGGFFWYNRQPGTKGEG